MGETVLKGSRTEWVDDFYGNTTVTQYEPLMVKRYDNRSKGSSPILNGWRNPSPYGREIGELWSPSVQIVSEKMHKTSGQIAYKARASGYVDFSGYSMLPALSVVKDFDHDLVDRTVIDALTKFSDGPIDIGVLLGERRESLQFLTASAERALGVVKAVKRRDVKGIKRLLRIQENKQLYHRSTLHEVLDAPTDLWLSSALAVKPMVSDAYGIMEALEKKEEAAPPMKKGESRHSSSRPFDIRYSHVIGSNYFTFGAKDKYVSLCHVRFDAEMENDLLFRLNSVGVTNPLSLGWNLLPLSFVADYFGNIGDYFQAAGSTAGLKFKSGSLTRTVKRHVKWKYIGLHPTSWQRTWHPGPGCYALCNHMGKEETATTRTVYSKFPSALTDFAPRFKNELDPRRLMTVSSLLAQFTK